MTVSELPRAAISAIGSTSSVSDPCSVVKELVDNALDADATSISIVISHNALDVIQVKDNGTGILPNDRGFACKPSYTSKMQTLEDLRKIGPKSLGFRGLALASMAEMSGALAITTRVDGEPIGSVLTYDRAGELLGREPVAHPVGTTVRLSEFLKHLPVRRKASLKISTKIITKVKKLLHSYAISRPVVRLSLKVLGGKGDNNWVYPATQGTSVLDAIQKIVGSETASQCTTKKSKVLSNDRSPQDADDQNLSTQYVIISATLPRADADLSRVMKCGQYICLDGRPLSADKGIGKAILKAYKPYLRSISEQNQSKTTITDPFLTLHISCLSGIYDVNVEPGKDDVLFERSSLIISAVEDLFKEVYGDSLNNDQNDQETYTGTVEPNSSLHSRIGSATVPQARRYDLGSDTDVSPTQRPAWLSDGISRSAAAVMDTRAERNTTPSDNNITANPWSREKLGGGSTTADKTRCSPQSDLDVTPVHEMSRLPLTPLTGQQKQPKSPFTTPGLSSARSAGATPACSPVARLSRDAFNIPSQRPGVGKQDQTAQTQKRSQHGAGTTLSLFPPEVGSVAESESILSPLTLNRSPIDVRRNDMPLPSHESGPNLERRSRQTMPDESRELGLTSHRFNRLRDSIQNAKEESLSGICRQNTLRRTLTDSQRDIDSPTITHGQSSQRPVPQSQNSPRCPTAASLARETPRRQFTSPLPLESIPDRFAIHHLSVGIPLTPAQSASMVKQLAPFDSYIETGVDSFELCRRQSSDVVADWKSTIDEIVPEKWPLNDANLDQVMAIDLNQVLCGLWEGK